MRKQMYLNHLDFYLAHFDNTISLKVELNKIRDKINAIYNTPYYKLYKSFKRLVNPSKKDNKYL